MISNNWKHEVNKEVETILSRVIMVEVPEIDVEASYYLSKNEYKYKYLTAIDINDGTYGIYEVKNNDVVAYAHGKCVSVGNTKPGIYKIVETKSHLDYHDARYWNVVKLEEIHTGEELIVSTPPYEIADAPITPSDIDDLGGVEVGSESMLTVYDNGEDGIKLLVIDGNSGEYLDGKEHKN